MAEEPPVSEEQAKEAALKEEATYEQKVAAWIEHLGTKANGKKAKKKAAKTKAAVRDGTSAESRVHLL